MTRKAAAVRIAVKPVLRAGGNPHVPKGDGDGPVQAYIADMPAWKHDIGRRLDALIKGTVPNLRKAVKWNSPFYGSAGQGQEDGWFLSFHCFTSYIKLAFCRGASLNPLRPASPNKNTCATSTSTRTTRLTKLSWRTG